MLCHSQIIVQPLFLSMHIPYWHCCSLPYVSSIFHALALSICTSLHLWVKHQLILFLHVLLLLLGMNFSSAFWHFPATYAIIAFIVSPSGSLFYGTLPRNCLMPLVSSFEVRLGPSFMLCVFLHVHFHMVFKPHVY